MYTQNLKTASISLLGLTFCISLCACSTTSETFDCPAGKGVGCKSISAVNHMVNQEEQPQGPLGSLEERGAQFITPLSAPVISADSLGVETLSKQRDASQSDIPLSDTMAVHRIQEEHLRVWIAPYQDAQGNLHEGSIVHTVLKPGCWQVRVTDSKVSDSRVVDPRVVDPSVSDTIIDYTNTDNSGVADSRSSDLEGYP